MELVEREREREGSAGARASSRSSETDVAHPLVPHGGRGQGCVRTEPPANSRMP